jgi:uncharacterized membrane protein
MMYTIYNLFKFLHVAAAILWIGGVCTLSLINLRLARKQDRTALASLSRQSGFYGRAIIAPAAAVTLIAGIVMVASSGLNFGALWITWGFAGLFGSIALGAAFIRRVTEALVELAPAAAPADPQVIALQRRLATLNLINLLILLSTVGAMVFKPIL